MITTWITHGFDKVLGSAKAPEILKTEYDLYMAKNESETVHVCFVSDSEQTVTFTLEGSHKGVSYEMFTETFVPVRGELYPDPLVPIDGKIKLNTETPTNVLIEFTSEDNADAGNTVYTLTAKNDDGSIIQTYKINLKVWDFVLPETPACETAMGITLGALKKFHKTESAEEDTQLLKTYYDELLKHKISAYSIPYDILDPRADEYMSNPRVTSFCCDLDPGTYSSSRNDERIKAIGKKVASRPDWLYKAYVYPLDEPTTMEHLNKLKEHSDRLHNLMPGVHQVVPFYRNIDVDENTDQIAFMAPLHDVWCPKAKLFREVYSEEQEKKYPPFYDRMMQYKKEGSRIWWYVCNYPQPPYLNVFTNDIGLHSRALFWLQYRYEVTGFLYWSTNHWNNLEDPWIDTDTFRNDIHGDGILFYPGTKVGINGPVAALRLKLVRDGVEDIDLFTLAEKELGREVLVEKILSAVPSLVEVKADSDTFYSIRAEIGNALEEALKK